MSPKYVIFLVPVILIIISNYVDKSKFSKVLTFVIVFNNYIKNTKNFKKNKFVLFKISELPKNINSFWLICQNFPSYAYGKNYKDDIQKKCLVEFEDFKILDNFQTRDLYIAKFIFNKS